MSEKHPIYQSYEEILSFINNKKKLDDVSLSENDLKSIIAAVKYTTEKSTQSTKEYLLQKRLNQFYTYYPFYFQHIPNHAIIEVNSSSNQEFIDFELGESFLLTIEKDVFQYTALLPFSVSPFSVSGTYQNNNILTIELIRKQGFLLNRNRFLLSTNPMCFESYQIYHLINILKHFQSVNITLIKTNGGKKITFPAKLSFDCGLNIDINQSVVLKTVSQGIFGNFIIEFDDLPPEELYSKMFIDIKLSTTQFMPNPLPQNAFSTNLLPIINIIKDYAMSIKCDFSQESYAIMNSNDPKNYLPTKLCAVFYDKKPIDISYFSLENNKNYSLIFEKTGHMRIVINNPDLKEMTSTHTINVLADWIQSKTANIKKKNYNLVPLSRTLGDLNFKLVYNYSFKYNPIYAKAEDLLKIINLISCKGISKPIFLTLIQLISNNDDNIINFVDQSIIKIVDLGELKYLLVIDNAAPIEKIQYYINIVSEFLLTHISSRLGVKIRFYTNTN